MNRHPGLFSLVLLSGILMLTAHVADVRGQATPGNIDALKSSDSVAAAGPQISAFVNAQVAKLTSGEPAASAAARDALIDAATGAKPGFLSVFAAALNSGIAPALKHESDLVRLNAAIAVARVAERADDAGLQNATITLLNDQSPHVALWGLKAARALIPAVLSNPAANADPILAAVVKAAAKHGSGAMGSPVAVEAYEALTLRIFDAVGRKPDDRALRAVIPVMQQLLQQRAGMYVKRIPPEPLAENRATLFLVNSRVWGLHDAKQKLASVQVMSNLVGLGAQHFSAADPAQRGDLAPMISNVSAAIAVLPETQPIQAQLAPAIKITAATAPQDVTGAVAAIVPALKTVNLFSAIQPPPAVAPAAAEGDIATQPSTAPTTAITVPITAAAISP